MPEKVTVDLAHVQKIPAWLERIKASVERVIPRWFSGNIQVSVFRGGITDVSINQSFKETPKPKQRQG